MLRLAVSVEGATEREFVHQVLEPHLRGFDLSTTPVVLGGKVNLDRIRHHLPRLLGSFDAVGTFYDLYAFGRRGERGAGELERAIAELVDPKRRRHVVPHVQRYEFEALLFSSPAITAEELGDLEARGTLETIVRDCGEPEKINDRYETCPSRRLQALFPGYDKKLFGPLICERIGLTKIRDACPRFDRWLLRIEGLAGGEAP